MRVQRYIHRPWRIHTQEGNTCRGIEKWETGRWEKWIKGEKLSRSLVTLKNAENLLNLLIKADHLFLLFLPCLPPPFSSFFFIISSKYWITMWFFLMFLRTILYGGYVHSLEPGGYFQQCSCDHAILPLNLASQMQSMCSSPLSCPLAQKVNI